MQINVLTSGTVVARIVSHYGPNINGCSLKLDNGYKFNFKEGHEISNLTTNKFSNGFDSSIMDSHFKIFGASLVLVSSQTRTVQDLNRISMLGTLSRI